MALRTRALALTLLTLSLCVLPAAPQAPAPPQDEIFADSIDVNVVSLEVSVTDRKGQRVTGLTRDDFEVYEDGKPVEITYFYASEATTGRRPAGEAVPKPERLQLAVFVDTESFPEPSRPRLAAAVEDFLVSHARPEEKVLLASYNGPDTLNVRELPASRPVLAAALKEIMEQPQRSSRMEGRVAALSRQMVGSLGGSQKLDSAMAEEEAAVAEFERIVKELLFRMRQRSALDALEGFVASLGSRPGRKALLYASGGITFRPDQSIVDAFVTKLGPRALSGPLSSLVGELEEAAQSDRVVFYALGALDPRVARPSISVRTNVPSPQVIDRSREITDANPSGSLAWISEDLFSYYSLGYTPAERKPGRRHQVEVKVKRRGLHVRHIESYRDRTPEDRAQKRMQAALLLGSGGGENPLGVTVELGAAAVTGKDRVRVPVTMSFPLSRVALLPGEGGMRHGRLSVFVTARDSKGRVAAVDQTELPLRLDEPVPPGISYDFQLALRSEPHEIVLGVWDEVGNMLSTVTTRYDPAAQSAQSGGPLR
jgi:VWFA-related protein